MKRLVLCSILVSLAGSVVATAEPQSHAVGDALTEGRSFKYQFRAGRYDVAPQAVEHLEAAVRKHPGSVELWNELGTAHFMQLTAVMRAGAQPQLVGGIMQNARNAYERALQLDGTDAYALAGRGMARIVLAKGPEGSIELRAALGDLDRAVQLEPARVPVRLMRGFTSLALPRQMRDIANVESDLRFLQNVAAGTRAADRLAVLLGDVYLEDGRARDARQQYEAAAPSASSGGELARARLAAVEGAGVNAGEIAQLRAKLGSDCTMCHGR